MNRGERMTNTDPLPGIAPAEAPIGDVERAARETIDAIDAQGLLSARDSLLRQTLKSLARQMDQSMRCGGKGYADALIAGQIRETIEALPDSADDGEDAWSQLERSEEHTSELQAGFDLV